MIKIKMPIPNVLKLAHVTAVSLGDSLRLCDECHGDIHESMADFKLDLGRSVTFKCREHLLAAEARLAEANRRVR